MFLQNPSCSCLREWRHHSKMSRYHVCLKEKITSGCFYLNYMAQDSFTSVFLPSITSSVNQVSKACLCLCGDLQSGVGRWTIALRGHELPSMCRLSLQAVGGFASLGKVESLKLRPFLALPHHFFPLSPRLPIMCFFFPCAV